MSDEIAYNKILDDTMFETRPRLKIFIILFQLCKKWLPANWTPFPIRSLPRSWRSLSDPRVRNHVHGRKMLPKRRMKRYGSKYFEIVTRIRLARIRRSTVPIARESQSFAVNTRRRSTVCLRRDRCAPHNGRARIITELKDFGCRSKKYSLSVSE